MARKKTRIKPNPPPAPNPEKTGIFECRECGTDLTPETSIFLTSANTKHDKPICKSCYESAVRQQHHHHDRGSNQRSNRHMAQRFTMRSDEQYHGNDIYNR